MWTGRENDIKLISTDFTCAGNHRIMIIIIRLYIWAE